MPICSSKRVATLALGASVLCAATAVAAAPLRAAVASNFQAAFTAVAEGFPGDTEATYGSSGLLFAQIIQGRPFDVFLSADRLRPLALIERGRAAAPVVYARGALALLANQGTPGPSWFADAKRVAIANPDTAPYGRAARETLAELGTAPQRITALNVAQAFHFAASGAADGAFVALAQIKAQDVADGRYWVVPDTLHKPIEQVAVVVLGGREAAARTFLDYLVSDDVQTRIVGAGYRPAADNVSASAGGRHRN